MLKFDEVSRKTREEQTKRDAFSRWLNEPTTKIVVSMIPQGADPEHVQTVLRAAWESGFATGQGAVAIELLGAMLEREK